MNSTLQRLDGATITDSANILFEGRIDDGDLNGSIDVPEGGDQSANLVVSGTTSGVTLKDISIGSGAGEPSSSRGATKTEGCACRGGSYVFLRLAPIQSFVHRANRDISNACILQSWLTAV